jgi:hypothetical protein
VNHKTCEQTDRGTHIGGVGLIDVKSGCEKPGGGFSINAPFLPAVAISSNFICSRWQSDETEIQSFTRSSKKD